MVSCPLLPLSVGTDTPGPPKAAKNPSMGHSVAFCIEDAGTGENVNLCLRIEKMCFCIEENYPSDKRKSTDFQSMLYFLERLTRLELATSTLARWRSTR